MRVVQDFLRLEVADTQQAGVWDCWYDTVFEFMFVLVRWGIGKSASGNDLLKYRGWFVQDLADTQGKLLVREWLLEERDSRA